MQALFLVQRFDYGNPQRGSSYEYVNFLPALEELGYDVTVFDYPTQVRSLGRSAANRQLHDIVNTKQPHLLFGVVRGDYISRRLIRHITEQTSTITINWFCDDHWQFDHETRRWAEHFSAVATTSQNAMKRYREHSITNVIKSQWAANPRSYPRPAAGDATKMRYDVSFVGQPYGIRRDAIEALRRAGIKVHTWGQGWPEGKLDHQQMVEVFATSRINLNFADASQAAPGRLETLANSSRLLALQDKPFVWRGWTVAQQLAAWQKKHSAKNTAHQPLQIKGRVFEVPCCGGFLLTQPAENLYDYLKPGKECGVFDDVEDLVNRVRYYLAKDDERAEVAEAGYRRVLAEHRWDQRLASVITAAGAKLPATADRRTLICSNDAARYQEAA